MLQKNIDLDTIVAIITPPGTGAIGVIRLSGKDALIIADKVFVGKNKIQTSKGYRALYGKFMDKEVVLDEVIVTVFRAPHSYTGEEAVEFSFHGSPYILQRALQIFIKKGARLAKPGEFTLRAFLNKKLDLSQAEAVADLIAAENESAHQLAMQQLRGGYSQKLATLRQQLIDFAALVELELDFSEEDVEFADRSQLKALILHINKEIQSLLQSFALGNAIKKGIQTVIAGRPNAGKSTLLNALLEDERAIVSDIPGTTRDTIEENLNIRGVNFRLIDTAGIREATDAIESIGVQRTLQEINKSAVLMYVYDLSELNREEVLHDIEQLKHDRLKVLVVGNKIDRLSQLPETFVENQVFISAREKKDIEHLKDRLFEIVMEGGIQEGQILVSNIRHYEALMQAAEMLNKVLFDLDSRISSELLAMDIRQALYHIGEIVGQVTSDDLLDSIFSRFCIGK
ncbi:MAG: tRNA uridine-5-carboxymethylaminomethyl(34) synthesis GTPase MnmE [Flavobacteriales bacterium]|nr:tRNA uridine-5-carboxymethylaminomethyl(34) synthesis GTPase MnmE [Flavobacteriales bacterium]